jgi:guanylate kinase
MNNSQIYKNNLFIISSPSGAGKTSITKNLLDSYDNLCLSISVTTRKKRQNEQEGQDYFFIAKEQYDIMIQNHELLEYAEVFGNYYGTPRKFVLDKLSQGQHVVFDIDWQGARELQKHKELNIVSIFILPPSLDELAKRLQKRGLDSNEVIAKRMAKAKNEISHYEEYDYVILNDHFTTAIDKIKKIIDFHNLNAIKAVNFSSLVKTKLS